MTTYSLPTSLEAAKARTRELRNRMSDDLDAMRSMMDRGLKSKADDEAYMRIESRFDSTEAELKAVEGAFPGTRQEIAGVAARNLALGAGTHDPNPTDRRSMTEQAAETYNAGDYSIGEAEGFSLGRAVRGMVTGSWSNGDLERRALAEGVDATGGFLLPTLLSAQVIDRLRPKMAVTAAGAPVLPVEGLSLRVPRIASGVTGYWKEENAANTESAPSFEAVTLTPKTVVAQVKLSREMFEDMSSVAMQAIENEILSTLAAQIDSAALTGTGSSNQPTGLLNTAGVTQVANGTNGSTASWSMLSDSVKRLRTANVEPTATITHPRTWATLGSLTDTTGQPLRQPPYTENVAQLDTTAIPTNVTAGSSSDTTYAFTGDFSKLFIGSKLANGFGIRMLTDQSAALDSLSVLIVAYGRVDFAVAHPEAFVIQKGIKA